jgi:hypothetical protein
MKFVEVKEVPEKKKRTNRGVLRDYLQEFMKMNLKAVKVEDHGYKSANAAYKSLNAATKRWVFPIDVVIRNGEVYLIRRDI